LSRHSSGLKNKNWSNKGLTGFEQFHFCVEQLKFLKKCRPIACQAIEIWAVDIPHLRITNSFFSSSLCHKNLKYVQVITNLIYFFSTSLGLTTSLDLRTKLPFQIAMKNKLSSMQLPFKVHNNNLLKYNLTNLN
jgi:hypothetical protein